MRRGTQDQGGFTLVELLVTITIIALLLAVLLPSLRSAREQAKLTVCAANLRQVGTSIHLYVNENRGWIPRGPAPEPAEDFEAQDFATNQLWIGADLPFAPTQHPREYNGLGRLLGATVVESGHFFCPADDNLNIIHEQPRIGTDQRAYGSYLYRQLDHLPKSAATGRLDQLGSYRVGAQHLRVEALALDTNSLGPGPFGHTNHRALRANVLFRDGSTTGFGDARRMFAIPAEAFPQYASVARAIDQILTRADYAYVGSPADAPQLSGTP
ncbi:MAG: prepilin-type N-terminal cleavage/methylation domain-containing protein [bacterium]|nr:prepilin-type N-terminal cleavage/methylation domain-containing protein [bacterium]